jgi:hypothetical protein
VFGGQVTAVKKQNTDLERHHLTPDVVAHSRTKGKNTQ